MKFTLLPFVVLLLLNFSSCFYTMGIGPSKDVAKNVEPLALNVQDRTHFTDLVDDVIFLIFDELDLLSLLRMGQTSKQISSLVTEYFTRHFSLKCVSLTGGITGKPTSQSIWMNDGVKIRHYGISLNILKQFGSKIKGLIIYTNNFTPEQLQIVVNYMNEYCANTLISLEFFGVRSVNAQLTKFGALESLQFSNDFKHFPNGKNALNEIFPNLRRLSIRGVANVDLLDCVLPHLEHLEVELPFQQTSLLPFFDTIKQFLRINQHIHSVGLEGFPLSFLSTVNEVLPQLAQLSIKMMSNDRPSSEIRFEHVTTFNFIAKDFDDSIISYFKFPSLDECQIAYYTNQHWTTFFTDHKNLTKLYVRVEKNIFTQSVCEFNFQQLAQLQNLAEFSLVTPENIIRKEEILELLGNHEKLTKCQFAMKSYGEDYGHSIRETFKWNWIIGDFENIDNILDLRSNANLKGFSLKKKTN